MTPKKYQILAVEDDRETLFLYQSAFSKHFDIHEAVSVPKALKMLEKQAIDLIILDLSLMGKKDGLDLTRTIRSTEKWKKIPIVAVTAHAFIQDRRNVLEAGCDQYVSKPVHLSELLKIIRNYLPE
ncbi:MAG: response regulator [FCB group bacterium]|nr:response regulator [FCB group bacterium]